jgi:protein phosphatase 1 regulatory subunit 7
LRAGLAQLGQLQELWLGRNRIAEVGDGLSSLTNLRRLSLQSNRLTSMAGLQHCTALEELYLSHNGIQQLEGLQALTKLKILDIANNRLRQIDGLETLQVGW